MQNMSAIIIVSSEKGNHVCTVLANISCKERGKIKPSLQDRSFNWYKIFYNVMFNATSKLVSIEDIIFFGVRSS